MRIRRLAFAFAFASTLARSPTVAAHGGLPVSETIFWKGDTLVVPTQFWGVFYGTEGGPWRWICEEAINKYQQRKWALAGDGTWHVTDIAGVTSSRDGGCTWIPATGELAARSTSNIVADPADPKRAWTTTDEGQDVAWNALFTTTDDGVTWSPVLEGDEYFRGVTLSADGKVIYTVGSSRAVASASDGGAGDGGASDGGASDGGSSDGGMVAPSGPVLHVSVDGGKSWSALPIDFQLVPGFRPARIVPLAVDPASSDTVYLRVETDPTSVLLRAKVTSTAVTVTEVLRKDGTLQRPGIGEVGFNTSKDELFIATTDGLYRSVGGAAPTPTSTLSRAQCVVRHGTSLYACSYNYPPDNAAISRSDDDGASFKPVFQYSQTVGTIDTCPASTPVGTICPQVWYMYAANLGIATGGLGDGGTTPSPPSSGCAISTRSRTPIAALLALVAAAAFALVTRRRRNLSNVR